MKIRLKRLSLQNFKGCKDRIVDFSDRTDICGANATGKTTIMDGFMWLLFDKDSTGATKFQIRPLDADGKQIDNVEIMVEGTLELDGKEVVLKKVQKQKWVKRRGSDITELQGNENLFEINGYPKSEKDYKEYISDLVDEELFKLITNPQAFTSLPWKKQREVLMRLVSDVSDIDVANMDEKFAELIPELEQASTTDIQKKYTKSLNNWKKKQIEIPARIDELSKQMGQIDVSDLELQANCLREQITETEKRYEDSEAAMKEHDRATAEILRVKGEMSAIYEKAAHSLDEERKAVQKRKDEAQKGFIESRQRIQMGELTYKHCQDTISYHEKEKKQLQDAWRKEKAESFREFVEIDASALICPTCGQDFPEEQRMQKIADHRNVYEADKAEFEETKKNRLDEITKSGNSVVETIKKLQAELKEEGVKLEQAKADSMKFNKLESEAMEALSKLPIQPDLSGNQQYEALQLQLSNLENGLHKLIGGADYRSQLRIKLSGLREELSGVEKKIASADTTAIEERIAELKEEQLDVAQKVADQERMIVLLESFVRAKMNRISGIINRKFKYTDFLLFKEQFNGGMTECCVARKNGVTYPDLNAAAKVQVGLDIINTLQEIYGVKVPIWIDNRESVTEIPEMNCQIINLYVDSECKELKVSDDKELKVG